MSARRLVALTDRSVVRVAGDGVAGFLQGLCTQDVPAICQSASRAAPAAFLSPRGKVLCDVIMLARSPSEFLLDVHSSVANNLLRLLMRHRLREPFVLEDVSASHCAVAQLPILAALPGGDGSAEIADVAVPSDFFPDPRFAAVGHRAVLPAAEAAALLAGGGMDLVAYHRWRLCCAVPEGPADLDVDSTLPLHANLDLLNFISFAKGCYTGQELTARTKHRGAVRRRFFTAFAAAGEPEAALAALGAARGEALPLAGALAAAAADGSTDLSGRRVDADAQAGGPSEAAREVLACKPGTDEPKSIGTLHSVAGNLGLCMLRLEGMFNERTNFLDQQPLAEGTRLTTAGGRPLAVRAPPYAFTE